MTEFKPEFDIELTHSEDQFKTFITIGQRPSYPYAVTEAVIYDALESEGIRGGILRNIVSDIVARQHYPREELIAEIPLPTITIDVSPSWMEAYLTIAQDPPTPYRATVEMISDALTTSGIKTGIMVDVIKSTIERESYPRELLIAQGQFPKAGVDAKLNYLFDPGSGGKAKDVGYRVDHRELGLVQNVTKGQVLIEKTAPVPGKPGQDITGKTIKATKPKDVKLPTGKNAIVSPDNPLQLISEVNGFVRLDRRDKKVIVEEVFVIDGDVDYAVGNLDIEGAIHVLRNVKEGFVLKASGDILVNGTVDGCELEAGGNIQIKGGIVGGANRAIVKAAENVHAKFADQANIEAGGNVSMEDEIVACSIQAGQAVIVGEGGMGIGGIVGGTIMAGHFVRANILGSDMGAATSIQVGRRPALLSARQRLNKQISRGKSEKNELTLKTNNLTQKLAERMINAGTRRSRLAELKNQQIRLQHELHRLLKLKILAEQNSGVTEEDIENLSQDINHTQGQLRKVDSQIAFLENRRLTDFSKSSAEIPEKIAQLKQVQQGLLSQLRQQESILAKHRRSWANMPKNLHRDIKLVQHNLNEIQKELKRLQYDEAMDQKIGNTIIQLKDRRKNLDTSMENMRQEKEQIDAQISATQVKNPFVIVTNTLWQGVEISLLHHRHRFSKPLKNSRVELSSGLDSELTVKSLR